MTEVAQRMRNMAYAQAFREAAEAQMRGDLAAAVARYRVLLEARPGDPRAWNNLGAALKDMLRFEEARSAYARAVELMPDLREARYNLGCLRLMFGDFGGFADYECRWGAAGVGCERVLPAETQWDGSSLAGRTLLLYAEQGFGDAIQFVRFVSGAAARGGRILLACQPELRRLFERMPAAQHVAEWAGLGLPVPRHDVHCPLMSLAHVLGANEASVAADVPYLRANAAEVERIRSVLLRPAPRAAKRLGLAWQGRMANPSLRHRAIPAACLRPLADLGDAAEWVRLQPPAHEPAPFPMLDPMGGVRDFADTAAVIEMLDLVVTIDTAVAHLAGAMGKPTWVLLSRAADWRWMIGREDSPWYPTMRLFRQGADAAWGPVVQRVREELAKYVAA